MSPMRTVLPCCSTGGLASIRFTRSWALRPDRLQPQSPARTRARTSTRPAEPCGPPIDPEPDMISMSACCPTVSVLSKEPSTRCASTVQAVIDTAATSIAAPCPPARRSPKAEGGLKELKVMHVLPKPLITPHSRVTTLGRKSSCDRSLGSTALVLRRRRFSTLRAALVPKACPRPRALSADDLDDDFALARAGVELQQHDLLPGAELECAVGEGHGDRRTEERRAHVARTVVVAPAQMVLIVRAARRQGIE